MTHRETDIVYLIRVNVPLLPPHEGFSIRRPELCLDALQSRCFLVNKDAKSAMDDGD